MKVNWRYHHLIHFWVSYIFFLFLPLSSPASGDRDMCLYHPLFLSLYRDYFAFRIEFWYSILVLFILLLLVSSERTGNKLCSMYKSFWLKAISFLVFVSISSATHESWRYFGRYFILFEESFSRLLWYSLFVTSKQRKRLKRSERSPWSETFLNQRQGVDLMLESRKRNCDHRLRNGKASITVTQYILL